MAKKKIAFVVAHPSSARAFLIDHIAKLIKDFDVHIIANFELDSKCDDFNSLGVTCHNVPIQRSIKLFDDLKSLRILKKVFKQERFECVHSVTPKAGLLTSVAGWMAGVSHRVHIFTGQVWATRKGMMRMILKMMDKIIVFFDTNLLVDGQGQRQFLIKEGVLKESNSQVLANGSIAGVKLERFVISGETRKTEREKLGFDDDDVCFIFMGRLNHDKGIGELYKAFDKLISECPKAKLVLYGGDEEGFDPQADTFKNIKRGDNYFYPGFTAKPFDSLQAGDVFVLPTWREGFGMSVIEAQGLGLPVITSDAYGVVDASVEGVTGLRCKVGDSNSLYEAMKSYYNNPGTRIAHGKAGRERIVKDFDNEIVSNAWVKFYNELLK